MRKIGQLKADIKEKFTDDIEKLIKDYLLNPEKYQNGIYYTINKQNDTLLKIGNDIKEDLLICGYKLQLEDSNKFSDRYQIII